MRLINADELKEAIQIKQQILKIPNDYLGVGAGLLTRDILQTIDDMPTVSPWISVEDRLPKTTSRYLCVLRTLSGARYVSSVAYYVTENEYGTIGWDTFKYVTHWMPFPEPPEQE